MRFLIDSESAMISDDQRLNLRVSYLGAKSVADSDGESVGWSMLLVRSVGSSENNLPLKCTP